MSDVNAVALSNAIALIYDSALDPRVWPVALEQIRQFREAMVMGITMVDTRRGEWRADMNMSVGLSEQAERDLSETYAALMPPPLYENGHLMIDEVYCTSDFMDYDEFARSRFFLEWAQPNGLLDMSSNCLMKSPSRFAMAACILSRISTERDRQLGLLLAPHIRRSVTISDLLDSRLVEIDTLEKALNALTIGVIVTDDRAKVLFSNQAAETMFRADNNIQAKAGILTTRSGPATAALWKAISLAAREEADLGIAGIGIPAPDAEREGGLILHILPLERRAGGKLSGARQVAIFIADNDRPSFVPVDILAAVYGLTPTETQVLAKVGQGEVCDDIARSMNVASSTIRTHLNRLLTKTGKRRQAELIKLVAQFSMPILPGRENKA